MAAVASDVDVGAAQREPGRVVIEADLLPALDHVARAAAGRPLGLADAADPASTGCGAALAASRSPLSSSRSLARRRRQRAARPATAASSSSSGRPRTRHTNRLTARTPGTRRGGSRRGTPRRRAASAGSARSPPRGYASPAGGISRTRRVACLPSSGYDVNVGLLCSKIVSLNRVVLWHASQPRAGRGGRPDPTNPADRRTRRRRRSRDGRNQELALMIIGVAAAARDVERFVADDRRTAGDALRAMATAARRRRVLAGQREAAVFVVIESEVGERRRLVADRADVPLARALGAPAGVLDDLQALALASERRLGELAAVHVFMAAVAGERRLLG